MKMKAILLSALCVTASACAEKTPAPAAAHPALETVAPYPAAEKGQVRQVIYLPPQQNEDLYKVELLIGKTMEVDCNHVMMGAQVEQQTLAGWGYDYYVVKSLSAPAMTRKMCIDGDKRQEFVPANLGAYSLQRYNSKLPIVIYTPADVQVKYRLWRAETEVNDAVAQ
ncbi:serine protease inhibitor ecotin [Mixta tenebrionis]|uniref:Serine protease inhibitor ecotin n=1 Tax=Mixta tenebrionis TaxID=2562439 RepID=A0A506VCP2_9GAMM|nr:serine protease inhibitor ecotin [Mixta tenebrionis]QHM74935.1 Ecotin [Mixta theicola]TPW42763.1 serine protease inhibitor ecotin [Mixta tenebrionis]